MSPAYPSLATLLEEPIESVKAREQSALNDLLRARNNRVVLFGAGNLGRRALTLLQEIGTTVVAFSDNNRAVWNTSIGGIPVLAPEDAAALYGNNALFIVTIWNDRHWYSETSAQLASLRCSGVTSYAPLFWRFPDRFLHLYFLNDLPHKVYADADAVLRAEQLWADETSLQNYLGNIRWRALGDAMGLPGRPRKSTYFPDELLQLCSTDTLLDCGAFDGDTIGDYLSHINKPAGLIKAVEADAISFERLQRYVAGLPSQIQSHIELHYCAVGAERCLLHFESSGSLISKASDHGTPVQCLPIDELFAETPLNFIKMDIEGAEYDALRGARKVIERDRPILAICVYHTQNDLWRIPLLIHEMLPEHRLFLRGYEGDGFQTVLFAVPPDRLANPGARS